MTISGAGRHVTPSGDSGNDGSRNVRPLLIQSGGVATLTYLTVVSGSHSAIRNEGDLRLYDSLLQDNFTNGALDGGGALYSNNKLLVVRTAFIDNESVHDGGALSIRGQATVANSSFGGNHAGSTDSLFSNECQNWGTLAPGSSNNLAENNTNCAVNLSSDPLLGPLGTYGGYGPTFPLPLAGGPALDAGNSATYATALIGNVDQRGEPRPVGLRHWGL